MSAFLTNVDIVNRALQHLGAQRIMSLSDNSKNASEMAFAYNKVKQAELRRNMWRFAARTTTLRPINSLGAILGLDNQPVGLGNVPPGATMMFCPPLWNGSNSYPLGAIVADSNGGIWQSTTPGNNGALPGPTWYQFFGSLAVQPYDTTGMTGYNPGELVYETIGPGQFDCYVCLAYSSLGNSTPAQPLTYNSQAVYYAGQLVEDTNSVTYMCIQNGVMGVEPRLQPAVWSAATTYTIGQMVAATDGYLYTSLVNSNIGNNPAGNKNLTLWQQGNLVSWTTTYSADLAQTQWQWLDCQLRPMQIMYPAGTGPSWQAFTRNVFLLPNGYLGPAPQDPVAGSASYLGAPGGDQYNQWVYSGNFLMSDLDFLLNFRFCADVVEVPTFDPMFCEGLALRLAMDLCENLTQAPDKRIWCAQLYNTVMREAREKNGIENQPTEPPVDDYIACRI